MDKYRLLADKDEIFNMVNKAPVVEIGDIWQTLPNKRTAYSIKKLEVFSEAMILLSDTPFEFENEFPIYIRINYKNIIFKLSPGEFRTHKNQLSCVYPKEAKAIEARNKDRTKLPKKSSLNITLRTLSAESAIDIKVQLEDVSESGIGVKASSLNLEYFLRNSSFKVVKVCGRNHMEDATLSVRHISKKTHKSFIGIGLSGNLLFSDRFFQILREEMKKERFASI
jgi:hypothetical protein